MTERAAILRDLPGLKEDDLNGPCCLCHQPFIRKDYPPLFFRLHVERFAVDLNAVRRRAGLGAMLGSEPLARVFSPNEDLAKLMAGPAQVFVCETCFLEKYSLLFIAAFENEKP